MFGFANALLLLLAAAVVIDFVPVLRCRLSPADWWQEERLMFTPHGASWREKYGQWAFLLGVMVYEFIVVFNNSMARETWPWLQTQLSPVLDWVMYLCFGWKILLGTRYNGRSLLCAGMLYFVARWVYFNGQNIWWIGLCVALLAAKDVPLRRAVKAQLLCGVPTLALVEVSLRPILSLRLTANCAGYTATATPTPSAGWCSGWCWRGCCCAVRNSAGQSLAVLPRSVCS